MLFRSFRIGIAAGVERTKSQGRRTPYYRLNHLRLLAIGPAHLDSLNFVRAAPPNGSGRRSAGDVRHERGDDAGELFKRPRPDDPAPWPQGSTLDQFSNTSAPVLVVASGHPVDSASVRSVGSPLRGLPARIRALSRHQVNYDRKRRELMTSTTCSVDGSKNVIRSLAVRIGPVGITTFGGS